MIKIGQFIRNNVKLLAQFLFTILFVIIGIWFLSNRKAELDEVAHVLEISKMPYIVLGIGLTLLYIVLQGVMYKISFASVKSKVSLLSTTILFLKRNFISVFIPAGGFSSLAFFKNEIEKSGVSKTKIHLASSIYAFTGILSVVLIALPIFFYAFLNGLAGLAEWAALAVSVLLIISIVMIYRSLLKKGTAYKLLSKFIPSLKVLLDDLSNHTIDRKQFLIVILISVIIDLTGIAHLYVAALALNFNASLFAVAMGYLISVVFLIISPFMRGLGPVEVSMAYVLIRFGHSYVEAVAITFLYRFFEFWLPLLAGALSFIMKVNKFIMRILPALLLLALGIINIISALTPAIPERIHRLRHFLQVDAINASNYFILIAGLMMLITAAFLIKGLRNAWWIAVILCIISCIGNLTKAIDYEEALVSLGVLGMLYFSRKEYYIRNNPRLRFVGFSTALLSMIAVLIYGCIGFYFLDKKHFNIDFTWRESIQYGFENFFLLESHKLVPRDLFAKLFLLSINISGLLSLSFAFYAVIRPYVVKKFVTAEDLEKARALLQQYGKSAVDYFKVYSDKMIFIAPDLNAFISYKIAGDYAVVLENPVAESNIHMQECIARFDAFCLKSGVKSLYYRVPEESLPIYKKLNKKHLLVGQEAVVNLNKFTLEGGRQKTLRNSVNKVKDAGYLSLIYNPPVKDGLLQKIKAVSDEWLSSTGRKEIIFSQGQFEWNELKQQTLLVIENTEEKIAGFLNIIPDYAKDEATFDLMRKTNDAPRGIMDFMMVELFKHLKAQGLQYVNIGFVPFSGIEMPKNLTEKSMSFAYDRIRSFAAYRGLRDFKEKFLPDWHNRYLVYGHDFDLLKTPRVLTRVIKA